MATTASHSPPETARTDTHRQLNLRNPLPLSASQEQEVRNIYYRRVRDHCAAEIKGMQSAISSPAETTSQRDSPAFQATFLELPTSLIPACCSLNFSLSTNPLPHLPDFATCAINRTITATWVCRTQRLAMNSCMVSHATPIEEDRAREEWFNGREDRQRKKREETEAVEVRRSEVIRLQREWEERERLRLAAEEEKAKR